MSAVVAPRRFASARHPQMNGACPLAEMPMTTSFAHAVRLEVVESARAQPLGLLLAGLAAVLATAGPVLTAKRGCFQNGGIA